MLRGRSLEGTRRDLLAAFAGAAGMLFTAGCEGEGSARDTSNAGRSGSAGGRTASFDALRRACAGTPPILDQIPIFVSSEESSSLAGRFPYYRIPGMARGARYLHCFGEGRTKDGTDYGEIALCWRRCDPSGRPVARETLFAEDRGPWADGSIHLNQYLVPCPVYDTVEGHLHVLFSRRRGDVAENRTTSPAVSVATADSVRSVVSPDGDGATWLDRIGGRPLALPFSYDQAAEVGARGNDWGLFLAGPGHGIMTPDKTLLAPGWVHIKGGFRTVVLRYDRAAELWSAAGILPVESSEASLAATSDGKVIVNARPSKGGGRVIAISSDNGSTFGSVRIDPALPDPSCMGSILASEHAGRPRVILFSNPASTTARRDLTIRLSLDDHKSFPVSRQLYPTLTEMVAHSWEGQRVLRGLLTHDAAYSDLVELDHDMFGMLLEQRIVETSGAKAINRLLSLVRFNIPWLLHGN